MGQDWQCGVLWSGYQSKNTVQRAGVGRVRKIEAGNKKTKTELGIVQNNKMLRYNNSKKDIQGPGNKQEAGEHSSLPVASTNPIHALCSFNILKSLIKIILTKVSFS